MFEQELHKINNALVSTACNVSSMNSTFPENDFRLLTIHAHPDDEASKGASSVALYNNNGVYCALVCCTGGEEGDILNPALDNKETLEGLAEVRLSELNKSAKIIGYEEVIMLGYRDSGMPDSPANAHPDAFTNADHDEAVGRLVSIIRRIRPQVIVSYPDDRKGYNHPDHLQVHDLSIPAFEASGDPSLYPDSGPAWKPSKLYFTTWSRARIEALHNKYLELGLKSPYEGWSDRPSRDDLVSTRVPISDFWEVRNEALLAHATQVDPESPFWFGLPPEIARTIHPYDDYILAKSLVEPKKIDGYENDLFSGIETFSSNLER